MTEPEGPWARPTPPSIPPVRSRLGVGLWLGLLAGVGGLFLLMASLMPAERGGMDWAEALRLFGVLALVSSGLARVRKVDLGATARIVAGWAAIFLVAVTAYALHDDAGRLARKVATALVPDHAIAESVNTMVIGRGESEGFYVVAQVDGAPIRFVIDTGSTDILLSPADARRIGLSPGAADFARPSETANGVAYSAAARVRSLTVGPIQLADVPVSISKEPMSVSLLGMPFLNRLDSFEVKGDQLFLRGKSGGD
jgi:aspartyl protease family protein